MVTSSFPVFPLLTVLSSRSCQLLVNFLVELLLLNLLSTRRHRIHGNIRPAQPPMIMAQNISHLKTLFFEFRLVAHQQYVTIDDAIVAIHIAKDDRVGQLFLESFEIGHAPSFAVAEWDGVAECLSVHVSQIVDLDLFEGGGDGLFTFSIWVPTLLLLQKLSSATAKVAILRCHCLHLC